MTLTTDPKHPDLGHGVDSAKVGQNKAYLILSEEERAKGFVRPVRRSYLHVGKRPTFPTRKLTEKEKEKENYAGNSYVLYEEYPASMAPRVGHYWTDEELSSGCGAETTMALLALCETYARDPKFYGSTYCTGCCKHKPVAEFVWKEDNTVVGS
jgi:hypothetical protein